VDDYLRYFDLDCNPITMWEWSELLERPGYKIVKQTQVEEGVKVSTVWLGLNHNWGDGPPLIFETMIFGGPYDQSQWRYPNKVAALAGHDQAVALAEEKVRR